MSDHSSDEETEREVPSSDEFEEVAIHVKKVQEILAREVMRVRQEKEAFDSVAKKLKHVHFSSTVKLNVGGLIFTTSLQTLTKDAGSMLHAMFSGRFDTKPGEDGTYFIDRDGTCFRYILNYLRTDSLLLPDDKITRKEVLVEAEFYQIQGIVDKLKPKPFCDSVILSSEQRKTLLEWLLAAKEKPLIYDDYVLLYRASRNGWTCTNFHSLCDNKGPTVMVIKSGNYVFGGYTGQHWGGAGYRLDPKAFLFSLVNPTTIGPTKMALKAGREAYAIQCSTSYGPMFGGGSDLNISNNPNSANSTVNISNTYECPAGQSSTNFLTGSQNFLVSEMEVYGDEKGI